MSRDDHDGEELELERLIKIHNDRTIAKREAMEIRGLLGKDFYTVYCYVVNSGCRRSCRMSKADFAEYNKAFEILQKIHQQMPQLMEDK